VRWLSDSVIDHLRRVADIPDLSGTNYEIVEKIGQGGMAAVYSANDRKLGRQVALKILDADDRGQQLESRLLDEARIIAGLEHPGIIPVHDSGALRDGRVFYAMKLVRGKRLDQEAATAKDLALLLRIFEKVCQAVAFAHAHRIIHRDLKPQNIMVGPFGEVLVLDWGVAKLLQSRRRPATDPTALPVESSFDSPIHQTAHGTVIGTPGYMAPEQARGEIDSVDERTDVYALGAILYFLLTGQTPSPSAPNDPGPEATVLPPRRLKPSVPKPLEAICQKAMSADRGARYQTVGELSNDLGCYFAQLPVRAYREGILDTGSRLFSKYRTAIVLILAYLVVRIVLIFWTGT
jgi:serine/threonine protein kinase